MVTIGRWVEFYVNGEFRSMPLVMQNYVWNQHLKALETHVLYDSLSLILSLFNISVCSASVTSSVEVHSQHSKMLSKHEINKYTQKTQWSVSIAFFVFSWHQDPYCLSPTNTYTLFVTIRVNTTYTSTSVFCFVETGTFFHNGENKGLKMRRRRTFCNFSCDIPFFLAATSLFSTCITSHQDFSSGRKKEPSQQKKTTSWW